MNKNLYRTIRLLLFSFCLVMLMPCLIVKAEERRFTDGDFEYEYNPGGVETVNLIGYHGSAADLVLPKYANDNGTVYKIERIKLQGINTLESVTVSETHQIILEDSFLNCEHLQTIFFQGDVELLDSQSFHDCPSLERVIFGGNVTTIRPEAIADCDKLESIVFQKLVYDIENGAFISCKGLKSIEMNPEKSYYRIEDGILYSEDMRRLLKCLAPEDDMQAMAGDIPDTVEEIDAGAFCNADQLVSISIPEGITYIPYRAFCDCDNLETVQLPGTLTEIYAEAFMNCKTLENIKLPENLRIIREKAFYGATGLGAAQSALVLPDSLNYVDKKAFGECINLQNVTIPDSVKEILPQAFGFHYYEEGGAEKSLKTGLVITCTKGSAAHCYALDNRISFYLSDTGENVEYDTEDMGGSDIGNIFLYERITRADEIRITGINPGQKIERLVIPAYIEGLPVREIISFEYNEARDHVKSIEIPSTVTSLSYSRNHAEDNRPNVFMGLKNLQSIYVDEGNPNYYSVDGMVYSGIGTNKTLLCCPQAKKDVRIAQDTVFIRSGAFSLCTGISELTIPESVVEIQSRAFDSCKSLESITIPDTVNTIGNGAFLNCTGLKSVHLPNGLQILPDGIFQDCRKLTLVNIPSSVGIIQENAFENCASLTKIEIPTSVCQIGCKAFSGCTGLTEIEIPDSVYMIEQGAFSSCANLQSIRIPDGVNVLSESIFRSCYNLSNIKLPDMLSKIERGAFEYCVSLEKIEIPEGVTEMELSVFSHCESLKDIVLPAHIKYVPPYTFEYCTSLTELKIPEGVETIESQAFFCCENLETLEVPDSVTAIDNWAFSGCDKLTIRCYAGSYAESFAKYYEIKCELMAKKLSGCTFTVTKQRVYTGKAITPTVTVKDGTKTLVKGRDYTVKCVNNINVGAASVKITGVGEYSGTITKPFKIIPKGTALKKVTAGTKQFTASWTKVTEKMKTQNITGYQIQYNTNKNFTGTNKVLTVSGYGRTGGAVKSLIKGKTYYVRIRTYTKVNGVNYFSVWSDAKAVKVK